MKWVLIGLMLVVAGTSPAGDTTNISITGYENLQLGSSFNAATKRWRLETPNKTKYQYAPFQSVMVAFVSPDHEGNIGQISLFFRISSASNQKKSWNKHLKRLTEEYGNPQSSSTETEEYIYHAQWKDIDGNKLLLNIQGNSIRATYSTCDYFTVEQKAPGSDCGGEVR